MAHSANAFRKVLVFAPPMGAIGGIQNYTAALVRGLRDVLGDAGVKMIAVPAEPKIRANGDLALGAPAKLRFLSRAIAGALLWWPDLVICTHIGVAPVARLVRKVTGVPYWLVLHGIEAWGSLPPAKERALRDAQRYIALTRFSLAATASRHELSGNTPLILPPPLLTERAGEGATGDAGRSDPDRSVVLTVGRLVASERYKGHDVILDAWPAVVRRVPNATYWIVGEGDDRARLESRARELGISDSVRFLGVLSGPELDACYDGCRVFAMPARTDLDAQAPRGEGFGIVFLEAMAHGRAVIGPNCGAPVEFIRSGEHGLLVNPVDPLEVGAALVTLLEDSIGTARMGQNAKKWAHQEFSYEKFCARLRDALQEERRIRRDS
jgi:phosphatidyl-myo-inositol dimannoside synthase